jgi:hypothetical protein
MDANLASPDAVIKQIDPEYRIDAIRPRYHRSRTAEEFGSISRIVSAGSGSRCRPKICPPGSSAERRLDTGDPKLRRAMSKRVAMALRYQRTNWMVRKTAPDGPVA